MLANIAKPLFITFRFDCSQGRLYAGGGAEGGLVASAAPNWMRDQSALGHHAQLVQIHSR